MENKIIKKIRAQAILARDESRDEFSLQEPIREEHGISYKSLFSDLDKLIARIIALCGSRNHFREVSTCSERESILNTLKAIRANIKNGSNFLNEFEQLKLQLRIFSYIDYTKSYSVGLKSDVEKLRSDSKELIKDKNNLLKSITSLTNKIETTRLNIENSKDNQEQLKTLGKK